MFRRTYLVFHAFPQFFDKNVVNPAPFAIHAYLDRVGFENLDEVVARELAALVGVEDLRRAVLGAGCQWTLLSTCERYIEGKSREGRSTMAAPNLR